MTRRKFKGAKRVDGQTSYHDAGLDALVEKLYKWLMLQPEWVAVLSGPRAGKREAARRVAAMVTNVPAYAAEQDEPGRESIRANIRILKDSERKELRAAEARQRRISRAMATLLEEGALLPGERDERTGVRAAKVVDDTVADAMMDAQAEAEGDTLEDSELLKVQTELADGEA